MIVPPPCWRITGEVGFEHLVTGGHLHLRNRVEQTVSGIVDPYVDALEMMQGEREDAVDLFRVTDVARKRDRAIGKADACARNLGPGSVARQHHHARSLLRKSFRNCLADAHRGARNHNHFPCEFHARVVISATRQVKMLDGTVPTIAPNSCRTI
jgi:hypothetical protein